MSTIPSQQWGAASKPGTDSQVGCVYDLLEGSHEPVSIVYYWRGTSLCMSHLVAHAKAHPLPPQPVQTVQIQGHP